MKRTVFTWDLGKYRKIAQTLGWFGKSFTALSACTLLLFLVAGAVVFGQNRMNTSPASTMKGLAASVSNDFFADMLGLEVPHLNEQRDVSTFSQKNVFGFVFRMLTDINPRDPKTLLAREVPGLGADGSVLLRKPNAGADVEAGPQEYPPSNPQPNGAAPNDATPGQGAAPAPSTVPEPAHQAANARKTVLIYHSHNRESWVKDLGLDDKDANKANDPKINMTLVGKELSDKLEEKGVGVAYYGTDYATSIENYNWYYSYKYSAKTVKEAFAANPGIQFAFDLHRDDSVRSKTTLTADGKDYAKVYFIIGQKNPNWEKNEEFASKIQERVEKRMPGLSRGIWAKKAADGNAEYNQSISPHSILMEIGGVYNTLEEAKRTADVLADVIAEMVWDAEKVDAPKAAEGMKN